MTYNCNEFIAKKEIDALVEWIVNYFFNKDTFIPSQFIFDFKFVIKELIIQRIENHWYPDEPARGSGYRSIIIGRHIDPIILRACQLSKINVGKMPGECVFMINPGLVKIRSLLNEKEEVIYSTKYYKIFLRIK